MIQSVIELTAIVVHLSAVALPDSRGGCPYMSIGGD